MGADKHSQDPFSFRPFEHLKKIIDSKGFNINLKQRVEPGAPCDEELFARAMSEVREIGEFRELPVRRKKTPVRKTPSSDHEALMALHDIIAGRRPLNLRVTQEYIEWVNPSLKAGQRNSVIAALHDGKFSVQDQLDLHGFVLEEAEAEVGRFLECSRKDGRLCVKIIHGRGLRSPNGPVLKNALVKWLSGHYRKDIVAFVTARQCDGGLGALYVLMR